MTTRGGSLRTDVQAREVLDELLLAHAQRDFDRLLEAASKIADLRHAGYRLRIDVDPTAIAPLPVKIRAQFESQCRVCGLHIAIDDACVWMRGESGVQCTGCGGA